MDSTSEGINNGKHGKFTFAVFAVSLTSWLVAINPATKFGLCMNPVAKNLFKDGMSWENQGTEWHVDHRIPQSYFTAEQWKEFEKITNMAKSESNDIQDTVQLVSNRVQCLCIKHNGIEAMIHLCDILIDNKHKIKGHLEIAQTFCNITSVQEPIEVATLIKSKLVKCGGLKSLINLYDVCRTPTKKKKTKIRKRVKFLKFLMR